MKKTVAVSAVAGVVAMAALAASPSQAQPRNLWGAVAYGPGGAWAYSVNHWSRAQARSAALRRCRGRCARTLTFYNTCGAYAVASNGAYGWGTSRSKYAAQSRAMQECRIRGPYCRVRVWACTTRY